MTVRRSLLLSALAAPLMAPALAQPAVTRGASRPRGPFWPGGARLAVGVCMMFETDGGQSNQWQGAVANSPAGTPPGARFPNFVTQGDRIYGAHEGIPRLLDMFDRRGIRVSSFMIGASIERYPGLAKEIVERGHEGGGRGRLHQTTHWMAKDQEREFLRQGFETMRQVTGQWPRGFNAQGLQASINTNDLLQELGLTYSIDDRTRDEPWIQTVNGDKDFCLVPYMGHVNDLSFFQLQQRSLSDYEQMLRQEFETLYEEGATRRRMMSMPLHDFVAGRPAVMRSAERFLQWAARHPGVWFARRDEIAAWATGEGRGLTPRGERYLPLDDRP